MLTDRYGLFLSTTSSAARDAYIEGCEAKLTMYPGAVDAFGRAIAADPGFALGSRAQLDLVEFTLLRAYLGAGRLDDARRTLSARHRGSSRLPVVGLSALH
jgi:hypothetical protein